jgi:mannose/cellobiose epimerase-like protein (N-acyl-D-glucosamine 2-epimerase family)
MDERFGREDERYHSAFSKAWALARDAFADPQHPGVCPLMDERGEVHCESKSHPWFVSYHTARALLFTADRLRKP